MTSKLEIQKYIREGRHALNTEAYFDEVKQILSHTLE